jgi:outer membrane lipoprotein carrier protein
MYYQQSNKLRWEYTSPYSYTFILNNDKVLLKNKQRNDLIDVKQNKLFKEIVRIMMSSVIGNCLTDDKNYKVSVAAIGNEWVATLLPQRKDMKQMFPKLILHFNAKKSVVNNVELYDKNGEKTIIELKNIRINETIPSNMFAIQ